MYIQLTTRCNMSCAHCLYACTAEGEDMSLETFKAAVRTAAGDYITLGGGEPTLNPHFWEMWAFAIAHGEYVWMATNGSVTDTAIALAHLTKAMGDSSLFRCELSVDDYHDPVDESVYKAFGEDLVRNTTRRRVQRGNGFHYEDVQPTKGGRCDWGEERTCCGGPFVKPDGTVLSCDCPDAVNLGTVHNCWTPGIDCWREYDEFKRRDGKLMARSTIERMVARHLKENAGCPARP